MFGRNVFYAYICTHQTSNTSRRCNQKAMTATRRKKIIQAITDTAKAVVPKGAEVILFGSQARGDARRDSDWDVLILLDKDRITSQDIDDYSYPLCELGWSFNEIINALLFTKKDWNRDIASPFHQNVTEDGIRLWG